MIIKKKISPKTNLKLKFSFFSFLGEYVRTELKRLDIYTNSDKRVYLYTYYVCTENCMYLLRYSYVKKSENIDKLTL